MKKVTEEMYRKYSKNVEFLARSFEKTTHIEADELFAYAWAKITYAIRFHDETKSKEATFIADEPILIKGSKKTGLTFFRPICINCYVI